MTDFVVYFKDGYKELVSAESGQDVAHRYQNNDHDISFIRKASSDQYEWDNGWYDPKIREQLSGFIK